MNKKYYINIKCFFLSELSLKTITCTQSLFKTSHVTRRPSLKRLLGIQVQLLSLCMGKHKILQNCSLSLRLNYIFEITNEIMCHKCCFFCSNSVINSLFLRVDQPVCMCSPERTSQSDDCFYSNRDFLQSSGHIKHCLFPHSKLYEWHVLGIL